MATDDQDSNGVVEFQREIWEVVRRYSEESDLTVSEAIGVLEAVKFQLLTGRVGGK